MLSHLSAWSWKQELEKGMNGTREPLLLELVWLWRSVSACRYGTTKNALLSLKPPNPPPPPPPLAPTLPLVFQASGYRVRCEGCEWSRGPEVRLETQGAGPALPRSYPGWIRCRKNTLHEQIVPGDWLVRLISLSLHRHAKGNNTGLSFISFTSRHLYVKKTLSMEAVCFLIENQELEVQLLFFLLLFFWNRLHIQDIKTTKKCQKVTLCSFTRRCPWP